MTKWWYAEGDQPKGPVNTDKIRQLFQAEEIGAETKVWRDGLESWQPLGELGGLKALEAEDNSSDLQEEAFEKARALAATTWPRFFARILDLFFEALIQGTTAGIMLGVLMNCFYPFSITLAMAIGWLVVFYPILMIIDGLIFAIFGNTPGKALLGLKVTTLEGESLSRSRYMRRNFAVLVKGLGLFVPFVNLATLCFQFQRLSRGKQASYDELNGWMVSSRPLGKVRIAILMLLALGVLVGLAMIPYRSLLDL